MSSALQIRAGKAALARIRSHGLRAQDVAIIPAAAGGPKGLILQALDQYLFGEWLPAAPRQRSLIGASIGAWRMAAASHADPVAAFRRLGDLYCNQQYSAKPAPQEVTAVIRQLLQDFIAGHEQEIVANPAWHLHLLTVRGRGWLAAPRSSLGAKAGFVAAALSNLSARANLAQHLERIVIGNPHDTLAWLKTGFDRFDTHFVPLAADNLAAALLASGTLPLLMQPVTKIPHAPHGTYWDGGLIDYHLALPYARAASQPGELVLYPHFADHMVPGWLDKPFPWRRAACGSHSDWLDNVVMLSPSPEFLRSLPRGKLPDRQDFVHYGMQHALRASHWQSAISSGQQMRDAFATFVANPDPAQVLPL